MKCSADTLDGESVKYYCCYLFRTVLDCRVVLFCLFCKHNIMCTSPLVAMLVLLSTREHMSVTVCQWCSVGTTLKQKVVTMVVWLFSASDVKCVGSGSGGSGFQADFMFINP